MPFYQILIITIIHSFLDYIIIKWEINYNIDLFYDLNKELVDMEVSKYENIRSTR